MSEQHHHHHHHKKDGASIFKQKTLASIERRKLIEKILKISMVILAIIMAIAVMVVYTVG
jgi:cell division protein FtsL